MSTYDDASLIYYPSGYKAGKAYSLKPTDGSGDLTFTRASTATRVNAEGLIEGVRTNLLTYSEQFDNAAWAKTGCTITANNTISPVGTTTADKMVSISASFGSKRVEQTFTAVLGATYTVSAYFKASGWNFVFFNAPEAQFTTREDLFLNLADGTLSGSTSLGSFENVGNGWYRLIYKRTATASGSTSFRFGFSNTASISSTGDGTSGIYIWGAMLEQSVQATEYIPTTTTAVSVGITNNVPRIDYTGGGCGKLLLEPQRTNLVLQSEDISSASWTKSNTPSITSNIAIAPDGTTSADGIQSLTGGAYRNIAQNFTVASNSTVTGSVFVKKEISETFYGGFSIVFIGGTTKTLYVIIDAVNGTGTIGSSTLTGTIKVEDYGNYWRISATTTDNGSNTTCRFTYESTLSTNGTTLNAGAGSVRTIWGCQIEANASYPTSYIPTLGTAVTRTQDSASKSGISSLINSEEGVLYFEIAAQSNSITTSVLSISSGSNANTLWSGFSSTSNTIQAQLVVGGVAQTNMAYVVSDRTELNKFAILYQNNNHKMYVNGVEASVDTSGIVPSANTFDRLNFNLGQGSFSFFGNCQSVMLFPSALTDEQLADLTGESHTTFNSLATFYGYTIL
mgnify:CR=1 FL=1